MMAFWMMDSTWLFMAPGLVKYPPDASVPMEARITDSFQLSRMN